MTVDTPAYDWEELWAAPEPRQPLNGTQAHIDGTGDRYALAALTGECAEVADAPEGTRNHTLNTAAFRMGRHVGAGTIAADTVRDALRGAARQAGLDDTEIDLVLRDTSTSALVQGQAHPRHPPPLEPVPDATVIEPEDAPDLTPGQEDDFWDARPLLRHLHDYARARRVSPWAVLGVTLARVATATPYRVVLPAIVGGHASLNMFVGLVGKSGTGKGAAEAVAAEAYDVGPIERHKAGSGEGIAHGYMRRERGEVVQHTDAVLFSMPEIDALTALGGRQGATLLPELRSAWSGEALGFGYADPSKRLPVPADRYRLCLVAGIQPRRAAGLLADSDGGTPQRFVWMPATDPGAPDHRPPCPIPLTWPRPSFNRAQAFETPSGLVEMRVCDAAYQTIDGAHLGRTRGAGDDLDGHALLAQLKTAAALALADGRLDVRDEDWELSTTIAAKSAATRAGVARVLAEVARKANRGKAEAEAERAVLVTEKVEGAAVKRVCRSIVRALRRHREPMHESPLRKALASRDRPYFQEALDHLVAVGQVSGEATDYRGQTGTKYRLEEAEDA